MDADRSHKTTTSEFFICFTSRFSSSSMKLSSKCILSPGRSREPSSSLSTSISRRLRNNGSIKGGQASPMFPTGTKKRGSFENPEPSSPKVTCIGQVRVKTKKQGKKMRARSKRRNETSLSFRRTTAEANGFQVAAASSDLSQQNGNQSFQFRHNRNRNQRWVHIIPLTICEALKAFGAEFSCLFPCRSSCLSGEREKEKRREMAAESGGCCCCGGGGCNGRDREQPSCGAALGRWLVTMQDGDTKGRNVELVVAEEEEEEEDRTERPERSQRRRHVFEDLDIDMEMKNEGEEEEKARVSICIPPKNALLLMRCRSDPVKMAALGNRFWESPVQKDGDEEEVQAHMEEDEHEQSKTEIREAEEGWISENKTDTTAAEEKMTMNSEAEAEAVAEDREIQNRVKKTSSGDGKEDAVFNGEDEVSVEVTSPEVAVDLEKPQFEQVGLILLQEDHEKLQAKESDNGSRNERKSELSSMPVASASSEQEITEPVAEEAATAVAEISAESTEEGKKETADEDMAARNGLRSDPDNRRLSVDSASKERENRRDSSELERESSGLPDCLLLMMCEPKLSMEVSKETWVCGADFVRWLPERPAKKKEAGDEAKRRIGGGSKPQPPPLPPPPQPVQPQALQPPRSSCSFPVAPSAIEQKLVGSNEYEPFVLTRCKSEPRSSAKLGPDACFWNNRKLEPHRPATLGVGAAGF